MQGTPINMWAYINFVLLLLLPWGHVVAQLVERKQEGHRFNSQ